MFYRESSLTVRKQLFQAGQHLRKTGQEEVQLVFYFTLNLRLTKCECVISYNGIQDAVVE